MAESTDNLDKKEENVEAGVEVKEDSAEVETPENNVTEEATEATETPSKAPASEEPSDQMLTKIRKQVEFYFGDVNMHRDKFLIEQTKLDDGWVPMSVMLNFKMLASMSKDPQVILKALEDSDLIEISNDRKKIRRSLDKPLPTYDENYRKDQEARTIYLKGFPADAKISMFQEYFESTNAVENIIMRKYKKGKEYFFKGSILVLFKTVEDAKTFMSQESIKYKDTELIKMWLKDYIESKGKEKEEKRQKKSENPKGSKNHKKNTQNVFPKGCILHISNIEKGIKRENIKEKFTELDCKVAFVDFNISSTEGYVRLDGENAAVNFLKQLDSNIIKISESDVTCTLLEGEKEDAYWNKIKVIKNHNKSNWRDKGRHGRKGMKRRHSPHRNENAKKANSDD
ncbi:la protein homolog [Copidosoma floridanum]|uniref:la protein homolog n=1 Tax=Copidosoma floridanum TaxID=29053 RepID=UPI0006C988CF|nr:la protein homolog [Copidosoma floridanum]